MSLIILFSAAFIIGLLDDLYYIARERRLEKINRERVITMEVEEMEKDYIYMNDGTPVEFNEDDQE